MKRKLENKIARTAIDSFRNHEIYGNPSSAHWILQRKNEDDSWSNSFLTEIICLATTRGIHVTGAIEPVNFVYGPSECYDRIKWVGEKVPPNTYIAEKASLGSGSKITYAWDPELAQQEIMIMMEQELEPEILQALEESLNYLEYGREVLLYEAHYDILEKISSVGTHISPRMIFAHAAINRLWQLIRQK